MYRDDGPVRKALNSRSFFAIFLSFAGGTAPNSESALMTRLLRQCGLSGGRSCRLHPPALSIKILKTNRSFKAFLTGPSLPLQSKAMPLSGILIPKSGMFWHMTYMRRGLYILRQDQPERYRTSVAYRSRRLVNQSSAVGYFTGSVFSSHMRRISASHSASATAPLK